MLKLMALYLLLMFVISLPGLASLNQVIVQIVEGPSDGPKIQHTLELLSATLIPLLWLGVAFPLLRKSDRIAALLMGVEEEEQGTSKISVEEVQRLVFVCMGIWFVVKGLACFEPLVIHLDFIRKYPEAERSRRVLQGMLPPFIWLAAGLVLIARPRQVSGIIERLQGKQEMEK